MVNDPVILAIETSTRWCSVAVSRGGQLLAHRSVGDERLVHAERLHGFFDEVLDEAGIPFAQLSAVAVGIGPGSYTGLRIGLSAAKGLCYALDIPIIGTGTLEVLCAAYRSAHTVEAADTLMPMIDARRMEVFTARHDASGLPREAPHALLIDEWSIPDLDRMHVFGDGADKAAGLWAGRSDLVHVPGIVPQAAALCALACERFVRKAFDDLAYLVPAYGKPANVTQAKQGG